MLLGSKEIKLGSSNREASLAADKNTVVVLGAVYMGCGRDKKQAGQYIG